MEVDRETLAFIKANPTKIRKMISKIVDEFQKQGCQAYVKTIYIGFEIEGEMVAALYAHKEHAEIALALDEDHVDHRLKDATHLTWRTLPLCLELSGISEVNASAGLFEEACSRVRNSTHKVMRDNEFFTAAKASRRERRLRSRRE